MPAFTPHLNLYMPGGGSLGIGGDDEVVDIDKLNEDFQKIDDWAEDTDDRLDALTSRILLGMNKGSTVVAANAVWTVLNTAPGDGTNIVNDGFTYQAGSILVPVPGLYRVSTSISFPNFNGILRGVRIEGDNGGLWEDVRRTPTQSVSHVVNMTGLVRCTSNFKLWGIQDSASSITVQMMAVSAEFVRSA